jgi:hypothetical protein
MKDVPVTARIDIIELMVGHRMWPSGRRRFERLNDVGSRPARFASPEGDMPFSLATSSIADQTA